MSLGSFGLALVNGKKRKKHRKAKKVQKRKVKRHVKRKVRRHKKHRANPLPKYRKAMVVAIQRKKKSRKGPRSYDVIKIPAKKARVFTSKGRYSAGKSSVKSGKAAGRWYGKKVRKGIWRHGKMTVKRFHRSNPSLSLASLTSQKGLAMKALRMAAGAAIGAYGVPILSTKALVMASRLPVVGQYLANKYAIIGAKLAVAYAAHMVAKKVAPSEKLLRQSIVAGTIANVLLVNVFNKPLLGMGAIEPILEGIYESGSVMNGFAGIQPVLEGPMMDDDFDDVMG